MWPLKGLKNCMLGARGNVTDGGQPAWAVEGSCLHGRLGLAQQQGKRVAHRLSNCPRLWNFTVTRRSDVAEILHVLIYAPFQNF